MKKKNEDEKNEDFFFCTKNVDFHYIKISNLADSKICNQIFHIYYCWKITALQSGSILPIFGPFWGTLKDRNFLTKIGMKNLITYLESTKFEVFIS